jgi:hypothetical protein
MRPVEHLCPADDSLLRHMSELQRLKEVEVCPSDEAQGGGVTPTFTAGVPLVTLLTCPWTQ